MSFRFGIDPFAWAWDSFFGGIFCLMAFLEKLVLKGGEGGYFFVCQTKPKQHNLLCANNIRLVSPF